ncbi:MAG TPA: TMEM43 family protein [Candidatus Eremiobacteraeota bacterium]|nr:TMEM43 family protein [Candidatus Eremiobacteraeota bacterium]
MATTKVTNESWFTRLKNALGGIVFGIILLVVTVGCLFWNEGRAVKRAQDLAEGAGAVVSVQVDKRDTENEGKLVHMSGTATTEETLTDDTFRISSSQTIKLSREVEMYQWKENEDKKTEKKTGGGTTTTTTYTYKQVWSSYIIKSDSFHESGHKNPASMPYKSESKSAHNVTLGAFTLSSSLIERISQFEVFPLNDSTMAKLPVNLQKQIKLNGNEYYMGTNPSDPQIGDLKIRFKIVKPCAISIISKQTNNTFTPYKTRTGGQIEEIRMGTMSAEEMFQKAKEENTILTWIIRVIGFIAIIIGIGFILKPIEVLADVIPFVGNIVGTGLAIITFLVAIPIWTITVAVAWIYYRPLIGIPLLVIALGGIVGVIYLVFMRKKAKD